jgi:hypothetical protein
MSNKSNVIELLNDIEGDTGNPSGTGLSNGNVVIVMGKGQQKLGLRESSQIAPAFPPLPEFDLDLLCDIESSW